MLIKNRIQSLREMRGLTQEQLAKILKTSGPQINRLEKSERKLTVEWILRLCKALDVTADELVDLPIKTAGKHDEALLESIIGFLFEACDKFKVRIAPKEFSRWVNYVYTDAVGRKLNFKQTRQLATGMVKAGRKAKQ
jgi:transcriptional regulator with XRE-family HTH domain